MKKISLTAYKKILKEINLILNVSTVDMLTVDMLTIKLQERYNENLQFLNSDKNKRLLLNKLNARINQNQLSFLTLNLANLVANEKDLEFIFNPLSAGFIFEKEIKVIFDQIFLGYRIIIFSYLNSFMKLKMDLDFEEETLKFLSKTNTANTLYFHTLTDIYSIEIISNEFKKAEPDLAVLEKYIYYISKSKLVDFV